MDRSREQETNLKYKWKKRYLYLKYESDRWHFWGKRTWRNWHSDEIFTVKKSVEKAITYLTSFCKCMYEHGMIVSWQILLKEKNVWICEELSSVKFWTRTAHMGRRKRYKFQRHSGKLFTETKIKSSMHKSRNISPA